MYLETLFIPILVLTEIKRADPNETFKLLNFISN